MLDPKKKKIYIIVICLCLLVTVSVLIMGSGSFTSSDTGSNETISLTANNSNNASGGTAAGKSLAKKEYSVPKVFPAATDFDLSVFDSSTFTTLRPYSPLSLQDDELGRDDPFKKY